MRLSPEAIRLGERSELRSSRKAPRRGRSPSAEQPSALRERKFGFALVLTNCPANTRGNSGNNWRVRHTISRPFFFAAEAVSRARLARLAKNRRVEIGSLLRYCRRCAGVESDFRSLRSMVCQWNNWYWILVLDIFTFAHFHSRPYAPLRLMDTLRME